MRFLRQMERETRRRSEGRQRESALLAQLDSLMKFFGHLSDEDDPLHAVALRPQQLRNALFSASHIRNEGLRLNLFGVAAMAATLHWRIYMQKQVRNRLDNQGGLDDEITFTGTAGISDLLEDVRTLRAAVIHEGVDPDEYAESKAFFEEYIEWAVEDVKRRFIDGSIEPGWQPDPAMDSTFESWENGMRNHVEYWLNFGFSK